MKTKITTLKALMTLIITILSINLFATTWTAESYISAGYWDADTVYVAQDVTVDGDLYIEKNTLVLFTGYYSINVVGQIYANGTSDSTIIFRPVDGNEEIGWGGIKFTEPSYSMQSNFTSCEFHYAKTDEMEKDGGALSIYNHDKITIDSCLFKNNYAENEGGAIYMDSSSITITNCFFTQNSSNFGGIIGADNSGLTLKQCVLVNNSGNSTINVNTDTYDVNLYNNTIANNTGSPLQGNFYYTLIKNNIFWGNEFEINISSEGMVEINYNFITDNDFSFNSTYGTPPTILNNVTTVNPGFENPSTKIGSSDDGEIYDWSLSSSSWCINAGSPDTALLLPIDFTNNPRISQTGFKRVDIGAYEYQGNPVAPQLVFDADLNNYSVKNMGLENYNTGTNPELQFNSSRFESKDALEFNGFGGASYPAFDSLYNSKNINISMWINPYEILPDSNYILISNNAEPSNNWEVSLINNKIKFEFWESSFSNTFESDSLFFPDAWQFINISYDGDSVKIYKNDYLINKFGTTASININTSLGLIVGQSFIGLISDIKIFDKAVSEAELDYIIEDYGINGEHWNNIKDITFYVNMGSYINSGDFNPATGTVNISNDLGSEMFDYNNNGVYETTINDLELGEIYNFKFEFNSNINLLESFDRQIFINDSTNVYQACMNNQCVDTDITPVKLTSPQSGSNLAAAESITFEFQNVGNDTIDSDFHLSYQINDSSWVNDTLWVTQINPGQIEQYTFSGNYFDFSAYGQYFITLVATTSADGFTQNDTLRTIVNNLPTISTFPDTASFDDTVNYWIVEGINPSWEWGVPNGTFIDTSYSGTKAWVTNLNNNHNSNERSYVYSPYYDLMSMEYALSLKIFRHSMQDAGAFIEMTDPNNPDKWIELPNNNDIKQFNQPNYYNDFVKKDVWTGFYDEWIESKFMLGYVSGTVQFRIGFISNNNLNEGFAFDDFIVYEQPYNEVSITDIVPKSSPWLTENEIVEVEVLNITPYEVYDVIIRSDSVGTSSSFIIPAFETGLGQLPTALNFTNVGNSHEFNIWAEISGGEKGTGPGSIIADTIWHKATKLKTINSIPYFDNFDAPAMTTIDSSWYMHNKHFGKNTIWERVELSSGNYAMATGNSNPLPFNETAYLESPLFDFSGVYPSITFYVKRNLIDADNYATLLVSTDGNMWREPFVSGTTNWPNKKVWVEDAGEINVWSEIDDSEFVSVHANLDSLHNKFAQFRLVIHSGNNWQGDNGIIIDSFRIEEVTAVDLSVSELISPVSNSLLGSDAIKIEISNAGAQLPNIFPIYISYSVNGAAFVKDSLFGFTASSIDYEFTNQYNFTNYGIYEIRVAVNSTEDSYSLNDTSTFIIQKEATISTFPYFDDFEGQTSWTVKDGTITWQIGTPTGDMINYAFSGSNALFTEVSSEAAPYLATIESPYFDFSTIEEPRISLELWSNPVYNDEIAATMQVSLDSGQNWQTYGDPDENWYDASFTPLMAVSEDKEGWSNPTANWTNRFCSGDEIIFIGGEPSVKFRFVLASDIALTPDVDGFAIDNFLVYDGAHDLSVFKIEHPQNNISSDSESISVVISNMGIYSETGFTIYFSVNGSDPVSEVFSEDLNPGMEWLFTSTNTFDFSAFGAYEIKVWTDLGNDSYSENDTAFIEVYRFDEQTAYYPFTTDGTDAGAFGFDAMVNNCSFTESSIQINNNDSSFVQLPYKSIQNLNDFTIEAMIKINTIHDDGSDFPANYLLSTSNNNEIGSMGLFYHASHKEWVFYLDGYWTSFYTDTVEDNDWHHIAIEREGNTIRFYMDSVQFDKAYLTSSEPINIDPDGFIIGQNQITIGGEFDAIQSFAGQIQDFKIWKSIRFGGDVINTNNSSSNFHLNTPVIDGIIDGYWDTIPSNTVNRQIEGEYNINDLDAYFKTVFDNEYFYILVEVTDDSLYYAPEWNGDNVVLFFDIDNAKSQHYDANDNLFRFNWGSSTIENLQNLSSPGIDGILYEQQTTEDGYIMEIAIPWKIIDNSSNPSNKKIGFDLKVDDNDGSGREGQLSWSATADVAWQSPAWFGNLMCNDAYFMVYYPFHNNANDESGNELHGTPNYVGETEDRFGNFRDAYQFNGISSNIEIGKGTNLINGTTPFTILAWINPFEISPEGTGKQYTILSERAGGDNYQFAVMDNAIYFSYWDGGTETTFTGDIGTIFTNDWQMVTVTYDGSNLKLYHNIYEQRNFGAIGSIDNNNSTLFIGCQVDSADVFNGIIDDVRIYKRALSSHEIANFYYESGFKAYGDITLQVDMSYFINTGQFDTANESVDVAGTFNGWSGSDQMINIGNSIYEITFYGLEKNKEHQYKFRANGNWDGIFDKDENRIFYVTDYHDTIFNCMDNHCIDFDFSVTNDTIVTYSPILNSKVDTLLWDFGDGSTSNENNPTHTYSDFGLYNVMLSTANADSSWLQDFTKEINLFPENNSIVDVFPYFDDFEGDTLIVATGQNPSWELGVPAGSVINQAYSGNLVWMTNLSGNYNIDEKSYIELPIFDFTSVDYPILNFNYWVQTDTLAAATIEASLDGGNTWENICVNHVPFNDACYDFDPYQNSFTPGINGQYAQWRKAMVNLPYGNAENVKIRIYFTSSPDATLGLDGIAIDNIYVYDGNGADLEILKVAQHNTVELSSNTYAIYFDIFNHGNNDATNFQINVTIDDGDTVTMDYSEWNICPNCNEVASNNIGLDFSGYGQHILKAWIDVDGEINNSNDTIVQTIFNSQGMMVDTSILLDMEGVTGWAPIADYNDLYVSWQHGIPNGSIVVSPDNNIWATGLESEGGFREKSYLYSPGFSLENIPFPIIEFDMWRDLGSEQVVNIQYNKDGKWWNIGNIGDPDNWYTPFEPGHEDLLNDMQPFIGSQDGWTNSTDEDWVHAKHLVTDLGGNDRAQFRFAYRSCENWTGNQGFAFDNFKISNYQPNTDVSVADIISPTNGLINTNDSIIFIVKNNGLTEIDSINITVRLFGEEVYFVPMGELALSPLEERIIKLTQTLDLSNIQHYEIEINVTCEGDEIPQNNYQHIQVGKLGFVTVSLSGYQDSFETDINWLSGGEIDIWEIGVPSAPIIDTASDGKQCWATNLKGFSQFGMAELYSPIFDFSAIHLPKITFDKWSQTYPGNGVAMQYSIDSGETWITINKGENWTNVSDLWDLWGNYRARDGWSGMDADWSTASTLLPELALQESVVFRFVFTNRNEADSNEGFAIDNFIIDDAAGDYNISALWIERERLVCSGDMQDITVRVANVGHQSVNNFDVILDIPGQETDTVTITTAMNPLDSIDVIFTDIMFPAINNKDTTFFMAYTDLSIDELLKNDTTFAFVWSFNSDYPDAPGWQTLTVCDGYYGTGIFAIDEDNDGNIWYGTMHGGVIKESKYGLEVFGEVGYPDGDYSWALAAAPDGKVWWSSALRPEISMYDNGVVTTFEPVPGVEFEEYIYPATSGEVWFAGYTTGDIVKYNSGVWTHFTDFTGNENWLATIGELPDGTILVSSYGGDVFMNTGSSFEPFIIPDNPSVYEIFYDSISNETWFGGYNSLHVFDGTDWTDYSGIVTGGIHDIDMDEFGNIWAVTSSREAYKYDGTDWEIFTPDDGLAKGAIYAVCGFSDGRVAFGSYGGGISVYFNEPWADFDFDVFNDTVNFYNKSFGDNLTYLYDFDDGKVSTTENPVHVYTTSDVYEVCLTVTDDNQNTSTNCKEVIAGDTTVNLCNALFDYEIIEDTVFFFNYSSENIDNYYWSFGDNEFSDEEEPYHVYAEGGFYEVVLSVEDTIEGCFDEHLEIIEIEGVEASCHADFGYEANATEIVFYNNSQGEITDYLWSFGDGNYSSDTTPTHTYSVGGIYEVCLTVYNQANDCMDEICIEVLVDEENITVCQADYSYMVNDSKVSFTSSVTDNITNYLWDFDDNQYSDSVNPVHYYETPGFYMVELTVFDSISDCLTSVSKTVIVTTPGEPVCHAEFEHFVDGGNTIFTNLSSGDFTEVLWSFGDGEYSTQIEPTHEYLEPDFYEVCLSIYDTVSGCMDEYCNIVPITDVDVAICNASFDYFVQNLEVNFNGSVMGEVTNYFWDFGDGYYSYDSVITHEYYEPGFYEVSFTVFNDTTDCMDEAYEVVMVIDTANAAMCNASFEYYANEREVSFINTSQGEFTDYFWNFGDGNYSTDTNVVYTYGEPGYYEAELTVFNDTTDCLDTYFDFVIVIDTTVEMCQAAFSYFTENRTVNFTDESLGEITDYFWDFGDGNYSVDTNAVNTYDEPGYYEVIQTIYNANTGCLDEVKNVIVVIDTTQAMCNARFSYYPEDFTVSFTSEAVGDYKQVFWDFDDGQNSNIENPVHIFENPGYYNVSFTVVDTTTTCFDTKYKVIFVEGDTQQEFGAISADYSHYPASDSLMVFFTDKSMGNVTDWYWNFGDNTVASVDTSPSHMYVTNDYYRVCQTVENPEAQNTLCKFIPVGDVSTKNTSFFTYFADSLTSTAYFQNESLGDIESYYWDFGDGYTSEQKDPAHTYADTGYYAVCLSTTSSVGRLRTYCKDVRIGNAIDDPCLFSCVWPGDANSDLEANHYDMLTIGLNYDMEGPSRENATIKWYGQQAQNWSTYQADSITNNKHGDCNGDGVINDSDTLAIYQNFAYSHYWQPDVKSPEWEIKCIWDTEDAKRAGSRKKAIAMLSPPAKSKAGDIYGIGYEIEVLNADGVMWDSVTVSFESSWLGDEDKNLLTFYYINADLNTIYVSTVRKDHENTSGFGQIATINFVFEEGYDAFDVSFNVTTLGGIQNTGIAINVGGSILLNMGPDITICNGDTIVLGAPEGFSTYNWSTGEQSRHIQVTTGGEYILTVADTTGAVGIDTVIVTMAPTPVLDIAETMEGADSLVIDAGDDFATYLWSTGDTTQTIKVYASGVYSVTVTNEFSCSTSDTVSVTITGIKDISQGMPQMQIYPNPNNGAFWLIIEQQLYGEFRYDLLDLNGKVIVTEELLLNGKLKQLIKPDFMPQGVYMLKTYYNNRVGVRKIIVQ